MISLSSNQRVLKIATPHGQKLLEKLPAVPGKAYANLLALPYRHDTLKCLKNIGVNLTGWHPMERTYQYPKVQMVHEMYPHAKRTAELAVQFERGFILNEPRTAKTSSMIALLNFLRYNEDPGAVLVLAPLSTITEGNVWRTEIMGMTPGAKVGYLFGRNLTGHGRVKHVKKMIRQRKDYYIINPDGIKIPGIHRLLMDAIKQGIITKMIIDESTEFGNDSTARWKAAQQLSAPLRWFWMATGTPGDPMTVYGQAKMMNPNNPAISCSKDVWRLRTMWQGADEKWKPKANADKFIYPALDPAVRVEKRDVWQDMPPELIIPVRAELDPKTAMILKTLRTEGGVSVEGNEMVPANGGVAMLRYIQIACGIFKITEGKDDGNDKKSDTYLRLPMQTKIDSLLHLLQQAEDRTVIYTTYQETFLYLKDELENQWIDAAKTRKYRVAIVNGTVAPDKRGPIFNAFNSDPDGPDILIAHPRTVSFGVELAGRCTSLVFFGVPWISAVLYQQSVERLFSKLQRSACPAIYWLYSLPQELKGFHALKEGVDFSASMANLFKED